jgi:lysophospholipid acyltransferase (LPLAT)-like uncharacterized protein
VSSPPDGAEAPVQWIDRPGVRSFLGRFLIGGYMRFVKLSSRAEFDPPGLWDRVDENWPAILVSWHGQSNMAYMMTREPKRLALLFSMHPDGQMMAALARSLGFQTLDGSGASARQARGTGGVAAFRSMLKTIKSGTTLFATADIPPEPGRNVSIGMIALARRSGRPMFTLATASSRRKVLERVWDRMQLNFPFSRIVFAWEGPFYMTDPAVTDDTYAAGLAASLDRVLAQAFARADGAASAAARR